MNQASLLVRKLNAQRVARWLAGFVFALGALALAGAAFDLPALSSLIPHSGNTLPDTGALFCASGLGVALFTVRKAGNGWVRVAGQVLLALVAIVGAIEILQNLSGLDLGIGRILPPGVPGSGDPRHPGHMSPISALSFLLVGAGLLLGSKPSSRVSFVGQALLVAALLLSVHVLFGYAYGL